LTQLDASLQTGTVTAHGKCMVIAPKA
jgi:hypothetical protein